MGAPPAPHPLDPLTPAEVRAAAAAARGAFPGTPPLRFCSIALREPPKAALVAAAAAAAAVAAASAAAATAGGGPPPPPTPPPPPRTAEVLALTPATGRAHRLTVCVDGVGGGGGGSGGGGGGSPRGGGKQEPNGAAAAEAVVVGREVLPAGTQPAFSPDDCTLAEAVVRADPTVGRLLRERYGVGGGGGAELVADPWSVHLTDGDYPPLRWREEAGGGGGKGIPENGGGGGGSGSSSSGGSPPDGSPVTTSGAAAAAAAAEGGGETRVAGTASGAPIPPRLMQMFLYLRYSPDDNHYAHPLDLLPIVDLNAQAVVAIHGADEPPPAGTPAQTCINYHRREVGRNTTLPCTWRAHPPSPLSVVQPDGPSFTVTGWAVAWQGWTFRVGFNPREGLVLHNLCHGGRRVVDRASLVEMAVPYGDPGGPYPRKCAFDVGDYGLGACAVSLALGCDCLGAIHYFGATLSDAAGEPVEVPRVVCMHEEDAGVLWKHVDYRSGHAETRRARRLIVSVCSTIVNYEYIYQVALSLDGTIDFDVRLTGELSTNPPSAAEVAAGASPRHGVLVAPGVNAQVHQHMFCCRLDVAIDGARNTVSEVDVLAFARTGGCGGNAAGNAFAPTETVLTTDGGGGRHAAPGRTWRVANPHVLNPVTGTPVAYKLVPATRGGVHPPLLTAPGSAVSRRAAFATRALWVTPHDDDERYPAGEFPTQQVALPPADAAGGDTGLPAWTSADRPIVDTDVVLWHAFGVTHVPRVEDFPVMPATTVGFSLVADGFFPGNPAVDLPPEAAGGEASVCCGEG